MVRGAPSQKIKVEYDFRSRCNWRKRIGLSNCRRPSNAHLSISNINHEMRCVNRDKYPSGKYSHVTRFGHLLLSSIPHTGIMVDRISRRADGKCKGLWSSVWGWGAQCRTPQHALYEHTYDPVARLTLAFNTSCLKTSAHALIVRFRINEDVVVRDDNKSPDSNKTFQGLNAANNFQKRYKIWWGCTHLASSLPHQGQTSPLISCCPDFWTIEGIRVDNGRSQISNAANCFDEMFIDLVWIHRDFDSFTDPVAAILKYCSVASLAKYVVNEFFLKHNL